MFRQGLLGIAPAAAFAAWLSCGIPEAAKALGSAPAAPTAPAASEAALIVLPGACGVHRSSRADAQLVRYHLEAEFPAAGPIADVANRLRRRGWIPLGEDARNAWTAPSLGGWTSFVDPSATPRMRVYSWWSEWTNLGGDHVSYAFEYQTPERGASALRSLSVAGGFYPAPLVRRLKEEATRAAEQFAQAHPAQAAVEREQARDRTMLSARDGDAFVLSGPAGEGVVRLTGTSGDRIAYRWRFRTPDGSESSGTVSEACMLTAGPYRLLWVPHSPLASTGGNEGAVGFFAGVDVTPIPNAQFESLDLGGVHALTTLLPERNRRLAAAASALPPDADVRRDALLQAGKSWALDSGRALLVQGPKGSGVIEIVQPGLESVTYRWRFRASASSDDASGKAVASELPFPELRVGLYSMQWQARSLGDARNEAEGRWSADVKSLPEELSLATIPASDATRIDLAAVSARRVGP